MGKDRASEAGWYRRNWKVVLEVWGFFFSLMVAMGLFYWFALVRQPGRSCAHVHTKLPLVEPSDDFPLTTCVVSGKPLRPLPDRVTVVVDGTEVQFCCEVCIEKFERDPEKYLSLVRATRK